MTSKHIRKTAVAILIILMSAPASVAQVWNTRLSLFAHQTDTVAQTDSTDTSHMSYEDSLRNLKWEPINDSLFGQRSYVAFDVIFYPRNMDIRYTPSNIARKRLAEYQKHINHLDSATPLSISKDPLSDVRYNYTIDHPEKVTYTWREIPDPGKNIREARQMKRDREREREHLDRIFNVEYNESRNIRKLPQAEKSPWTTNGQENLQMTQLFLENWASGGDKSISLSSDFRYKATYAKDKHNWESDIVHKLGFTKTESLDTRVSNDVLEMNSKYGYKATDKWYYSFKNSLKTQLFRNYASSDKEKKNPKSAFFSPAYIQFIVGMDYKKTNLSVLLSPFTAIITVVADTSTIDQTKFSIDKGKKSNSINGLSVTVNWKKTLVEDLTYTTKCELFYEYFEKDGQKRFDWENVFQLQINRFLTTRLILEMRYYENESKKFQFKENLNIAFTYKFQ